MSPHHLPPQHTQDNKGRTWRDVIRHSTRGEFESASRENDPELINKLIITGREFVQRTVEAFIKKRQQILLEEERAQK
jgi:hypothetical protein